MNLLSRADFSSKPEDYETGFLLMTVEGNSVVYHVGITVDGEDWFLESAGAPKRFKVFDGAEKAMAKFGFKNVEVRTTDEARRLSLHRLETVALLEEAFSEHGSIQKFVKKHGFSYQEVLGTYLLGRKIKKIRTALAEHVGKDPMSLWPDYNDGD